MQVLQRSFSLLLLAFLPLLGWEEERTTYGYFRLQQSLLEGRDQVCFKAPGAGAKYRLGNECESWVELGVADTITLQNGVQIRAKALPIFYAPNGESIDFFGWGELFLEVENLFDASEKLWVGRRYYDRLEDHLIDYWPLNMTGEGIGVYDLAFAPFKAAYALTYIALSPSSETTRFAPFFSHDLRLYWSGEGQDWMVFANYMQLLPTTFSNRSIGYTQGAAMALRLKERLLFAPFADKAQSVTALFAGVGLARDAGEYLPDMGRQFARENLLENLLAKGGIEEAFSLRTVHFDTIERGAWGVLASVVAEYKSTRTFEGIEQLWLSAGGRPYWFATKNVRLLAELGYDILFENVLQQRHQLLKGSAAVELARQPGLWERPVIRFYLTGALWSEASKGAVGGRYYADATAGYNAGIQCEYWW